MVETLWILFFIIIVVGTVIDVAWVLVSIQDGYKIGPPCIFWWFWFTYLPRSIKHKVQKLWAHNSNCVCAKCHKEFTDKMLAPVQRRLMENQIKEQIKNLEDSLR